MALDPDLVTLATGRNYAALATISPSGQPRNHVMWIGADDDHLTFNTEVHRAKFHDIERDPRVTITIIDSDNPYRYVEARGTVVETITGPDALANINSLAQRYTGADYPTENIGTERVVCRVAVDKLHKNNV